LRTNCEAGASIGKKLPFAGALRIDRDKLNDRISVDAPRSVACGDLAANRAGA